MTDEVPPRVTPDPSVVGRGSDRTPRNPYLRVIAVVWVGALFLGLAMLLRSTAVEQQSVADGLSTAGGWSLGIAGVVALVHLAVKAIRWHGDDSAR